MTQFAAVLKALAEHQVEFVIIGGIAVNHAGYVRFTEDVDVCYARTEANFARLVEALTPTKPYLRGGGPNLPFIFDARTLKSGLNFTLTTTLGDVDLLGEVAGLGTYPAVLACSEETELFGLRMRVLNLEGLERSKSAAGRPKDLIDLEALLAIKRERSDSK